MSKKRGFDIDFPSTPDGTYTGAGQASGARRGPMAAAINENAEALRERADAERAIREENDRLAHEHVRMKRAGLITDLVPLDAIRTEKLTRDRSHAPDPEIGELKDSIREIGLSNPIRVEPAGDGYELVQGFRRLTAYRELYAETGEEAYARIPAGLVATGEALEGLYRRMVDENLVRRGVSFAEMAQLALSFARDPQTRAGDVEAAVALLYASAGRQKRSYIRHFATLLEHLGDVLRYPEAIPRKLGLDLVRQIGAVPGFGNQLRDKLAKAPDSGSEVELRLLQAALEPEPEPERQTEHRGERRSDSAAKTVLRCTVPAGTVRCSARDGRLELQMDRDFSSIDRHRLEAAVAAFMAALDN